MKQVEFVFVHSFSSNAPNWEEVMIGRPGLTGRVGRARALALDLGLDVIANDATDRKNAALFEQYGIVNLATALNTQDEVAAALALSRSGGVLFVSSPDHLPRVVRDAMALGGTNALFAASDVPFSGPGAGAVVVQEPGHRKC